ncbi:hypothetical protein Q9Q99_14535 [Curtobacterium flaccumfaciens]|nr:hypothetical protein Q9Q99_14535 [Curtobacterium flaccumfaciens]
MTVTDAPHAATASSPTTGATEAVGEAPEKVRLPRMLVGVTTVAVLRVRRPDRRRRPALRLRDPRSGVAGVTRPLRAGRARR